MAERLGTQLQSGGLEQSINSGLIGSGLFGGASLDLNFAVTKNLGPLVTFTRASSATYVGSDGLIKTATTNEPRFDHNPTTGESLGLLVEEARTNLLLRSEEFDNASWSKVAATVTANSAVSPSGASTADKLIEDSTTNEHYSRQTSPAYTAGATTTMSVYVKAAERTALRIRSLDAAASANGFFGSVDISTGTTAGSNIGTGTFTSATATSVGNGWWRLSVVGIASATATSSIFDIFLLPGNASSASTYAGNGTSGIFLWGAQLEAGAFPTSYIPTTTAAATRSADVASITGANFSSWYRQDEGTVFAEVVSAPNNTIAQLAADISDAAGNERIFVRRAGAGSLGVAVIDGGVTQADVGAGPVISGGARYATAASYRLNSINLATNGQIGTEDTTATIPTPDRMFIGQNFASTQQVGGTIKRLAFFPQRLPNSTLEAITR